MLLDLRQIAAKTDGYTCAELQTLCQVAVRNACDRCECGDKEVNLTSHDVMCAMKMVTPAELHDTQAYLDFQQAIGHRF